MKGELGGDGDKRDRVLPGSGGAGDLRARAPEPAIGHFLSYVKNQGYRKEKVLIFMIRCCDSSLVLNEIRENFECTFVPLTRFLKT